MLRDASTRIGTTAFEMRVDGSMMTGRNRQKPTSSNANARSAEIRALAEYQIAQVDIAFATGTLLGSAQVRWEPVVPDVPELR